MATQYRLGVDVGGTHTDLVLLDVTDGSLAVEKVATTPANPALGIMRGIGNFAARGVDLAAIEFFSHGTTITTNALLEMRGAKVGLLINRGFRAIQETQVQARDGNVFDYFFQKPPPIAPQSLTREIGGRIDYTGAVHEPLDEDAVRRAAVELKAAGVVSIAVCYLFSFMNPEHERRSGALIREVYPQAHVSLSCEVLSRVREWPRLSATLLNAYLAPVLVTYIADLEQRLNGAGVTTQQRFLMQSNGGVMPFAAAITGHKTVHSLLSGPAAGAQASAFLPRDDAQSGARGLVTLDMGGTSCDIAFIEGAAPLEITEGAVARRQLDVPALDLTTISAGGGSIVWIDRAGFLSVGPQSAGADPGPVCYGRGGENPTVTDADIACGFLNPDYFLGGTQKLDAAAARAALEAKIAKPLNMTLAEAAAGIRRIVDMRMADEVRVFAARRGVDLSEFALLPFGGAGAVHAAAVAEELGMRRIIVPARPGAFSALGLLCTDVLHDYIRSELGALDRLDPAHAEAMFGELEAKAASELAEEGLDPSAAVFEREFDMRYAGQGYELRVPLAATLTLLRERGREGRGAALDVNALAATRVRFDEVHARIHGHAAKEKSVEVVSYRLRVRVAVPKYQPQALPARAPSAPSPAAVKGQRSVFYDPQKPIDTTVYDRDKLVIGANFAGPAIVEQFDATTVVPPGWRAAVDRFANLILERSE
ncbi:MAG TPA: hydantoinase/oxoprolinase family protein [Xanthobacteraceae bacterium]|nr:hydantoinase/oxoprolinase family protein [Xanthobacteraceae bacterium]